MIVSWSLHLNESARYPLKRSLFKLVKQDKVKQKKKKLEGKGDRLCREIHLPLNFAVEATMQRGQSTGADGELRMEWSCSTLDNSQPWFRKRKDPRPRLPPSQRSTWQRLGPRCAACCNGSLGKREQVRDHQVFGDLP